MTCTCAYHDQLIEIRRHLHTMPEEGWSEFTTTAFIVGKLREYGYEVLLGKKVINPDNCLGRNLKVVEAGLKLARENGVSEELLAEMDGLTGCVGVMDTGRPGPTLAIRFDIDCVPVTESTEDCHIPAREGFISKRPGLMHACGHDAHTSTGLAVAHWFADNVDQMNGKIKILFQPGEECNPGGASLVLAENPFDGYEVRAVVGEHVEPQLEVGTLGFRAGKYMASSDELRFSVRGTGGHGAMRPQLKDPVAAAAEFVTRLIALNHEECVLSIGRIEAGGATNIVPDEVYLEGTLRTFDEREREIIHQRIRNIAAEIDKRLGVRIAVDISHGYPCVVNDEHLVKQAAALAREEKLQVEMLPLRTTAEDFGFYCTKYPSLFYRLGVGAAAGRPHTATFNPDEGAINVGIGFMKRLALQILKK